MRRICLVLFVGVLGVGVGACGDDEDPVVGGGQAPTSSTVAGTTVTTGSATADSTTTTAAVSGRTLMCQTVGFTPNSEDAASDVRATGLSCAEAEAFVRNAGQRTSSGGPQQVTVDGYRCVLTRTEREPLPRAFYECTNGAKKVTFVRS